jgi:riboflavin biosynthesis pyrimidine reductase
LEGAFAGHDHAVDLADAAEVLQERTVGEAGGKAAAIGLEGGESVQWELLDRGELHLVRPNVLAPTTRRRALKNPS